MSYKLSLLRLKSNISSENELDADVVSYYKSLQEINSDLLSANIVPYWGDESGDVVSCQISNSALNCELVAVRNDFGYLLSISTSVNEALKIANDSKVFYVLDHQTMLLYNSHGEILS